MGSWITIFGFVFVAEETRRILLSKVPEQRKLLLSVEIDKVAQVCFSFCFLGFVSFTLIGRKLLEVVAHLLRK